MNSTTAYLEDLIEKTTRWLAAIDEGDFKALEVMGSICEQSLARFQQEGTSQFSDSLQDAAERERVKLLLEKLRGLTALCISRAQEKQREVAVSLEKTQSARQVLEALSATEVEQVSSVDQSA